MSESQQHPEPVVIASYETIGQAEVTRAHLAANGLHSAIIDEVEGGAVPVDGENGVRVLVPAAEAELARQILQPD